MPTPMAVTQLCLPSTIGSTLSWWVGHIPWPAGGLQNPKVYIFIIITKNIKMRLVLSRSCVQSNFILRHKSSLDTRTELTKESKMKWELSKTALQIWWIYISRKWSKKNFKIWGLRTSADLKLRHLTLTRHETCV
jgi:hypothetical protein